VKRRVRSKSLLTAAILALVSATFQQTGGAAEPPPDFVAVTQVGPEHTEAIHIAPSRSWFLTGTYNAIVVWDMRTGSILRGLRSAGAQFTRMAISTDGRIVFARLAKDTGDETETVGWSAETGLSIENAAMLAPSLNGSNWTWIAHKWPAARPFPKDVPFDLAGQKKYLTDQQLAALVDIEKVESIEATDRKGVIQVTTSGEARDNAEESLWSYHAYFIDVARRKIVADVSGKTLRTFCGRPHGAFAFDGRHLLLALTSPSEFTSTNINALLVDTASAPPALKWSRPCRNNRFSGMEVRRGLIVVSATPDQVTLWDPATGRRIIHIDDIHASDVLTWSTDLSTFATGFYEQRTVADPHRYGVAVIRSGKKLFFATDAEVSEVRLGDDGSKIFARTNGAWSAWDASSGARLSSFDLPAAIDEVTAGGRGPKKSPDGKFEIGKDRLIETASGRALIRGHRFLQFSEDFRFVWSAGPSPAQTIRMWETVSGRLLWQATANDSESHDFLIMQYADGRVLASEGAEDLVKFVRGFEVRPFEGLQRR